MTDTDDRAEPAVSPLAWGVVPRLLLALAAAALLWAAAGWALDWGW